MAEKEIYFQSSKEQQASTAKKATSNVTNANDKTASGTGTGLSKIAENVKNTTEKVKTATSNYVSQKAASGSGSSSASSSPTLELVDPSKSVDRSFENESYQAYLNAMDYLNQQQKEQPSYQNQYADAIDGLYNQITSRGEFNYDLNDDAMYQQYRDKYMAQSKLSMMDTMGQASALTGGYGSSYGQAVGQQAYDAQLQNLNDIVPELYSQAYQKYQDEGTEMRNNYNMLLNREADEYGRYQDQLSQWNTNRDYYTSQAETAYSKWATERDYNDNRESALSSERDANLNKLLTLAAAGYNPTSQEIADAGVTPEQWNYYKKLATAGVSSGGGSSSKSTTTTLTASEQQTANMNATATNLAALSKAGATKQQMNTIINNAVNKGEINQAQANELKGAYVGSSR